MKTKLIILSILVMGMVVVGYASGYSQALGSPMRGGQPPIISSYFAPEQVRYGDPVRIYLAAEDPDGEMLRIAVVVSQLGYGDYVTDWTYLKPADQNSFKGYLQWNTQSGTAFLPENTRVTLKISVFDKAGNESNEVVMPMVLVSSLVPYPPVPAPFDQKDIHMLGYVMVNLRNPIKDTEGHHRDHMFRFPFRHR